MRHAHRHMCDKIRYLHIFTLAELHVFPQVELLKNVLLYVTLCGFCPQHLLVLYRQLFLVIFLYFIFNCLSSGWWSIFVVVMDFHLVVLPVLIQSVFELVNGLRCHYRVGQAIS